ncbi:polysaccharide deacetylase family protein, partial [candidate division KSB1 bacterium]
IFEIMYRTCTWPAAFAVLAWAALFLAGCQPRFMLSIVSTMSPDVLYYTITSEKVAALTIDDGPHPEITPKILDVLKKHDVRATFFLVGERIDGCEEIIERMRREGHELGNHLEREKRSVSLSREEFGRQLLSVDAKIYTADDTVKWFRPGSGWYSPRMVRQARIYGYRTVLASVYPYDTRLRSVKLISYYVRKNIFPGSIIVLHDGKDNRRHIIDVLDHILPALKKRGYRIVTVGELVRLTDYYGK